MENLLVYVMKKKPVIKRGKPVSAEGRFQPVW